MTNNFLDWQELFVNDISGGEGIFIALSFILIMIMAAKFRFPNSVTFMILAVYAIIMAAFFEVLKPITLFLIAIFISFAMFKIFSTT